MENRLLFFSSKYNNLPRYISYHYQINLSLETKPNTILELGKGNGVFTNFFKELLGEENVVSIDHNAGLNPDVVGDIRKLRTASPEYDLVTAFEILEHIPFADFVKLVPILHHATNEYVIISLPINKNYFGERKGKLHAGHEWEINDENRLTDVRALLDTHFVIEKEVNPKENPYHYFFVLRKRGYDEI